MNVVHFLTSLMGHKIDIGTMWEEQVLPIARASWDPGVSQIVVRYVTRSDHYTVLGLSTILHELGHAWHHHRGNVYLSDVYGHEIEAWRWAFQTARELGLLPKYSRALAIHCKCCLTTYRTKYDPANEEPLWNARQELAGVERYLAQIVVEDQV